ncbi:MAG: lipase family protein [Planctomycetes bacterium]|nr:lipase family protein [Planctomycetota bacterium]MCB9935392.1 lipase family protein [Planctomycetota bacterium]
MAKRGQAARQQSKRYFDPEFAAGLVLRRWQAPRPGVFSARNAWNLMLASYVAYAFRDTATRELKRLGLLGPRGGLVWSERKNDAAFVVSNGRHAVIAARGSDELRDWLDNLNVSLDRDAMGKVHGGTREALARVWEGIAGPGLELAKGAKHLWLTGHSRGALMATVMAARLSERGVAIDGLYTFGSPRIGDAGFCATLQAALKGRIHRVKSADDWMGEMPPNPPYKHEHVGLLTELDDRSEESAPGTPSQQASRLRQLLQQSYTRLRDGILSRHMPRSYIEGLERLIRGRK